MKTINPFKRRNKEDFIPCSLFPASKVCDTSMPIGRAVPLYALDMVAGNRVSLDVSQLTRFQPMLAPVMTNYSVEFGAFYVPYVAFDEFFTSTWFRTNMQGTDTLRKGVLRAREFFNPAIESSEKVHPWMFSTKRCGDKVSWVGSLYDHLRAPLGLPDWSEDIVYSSSVASQSVKSLVDAFLSSPVKVGSLSFGTVSELLANNPIFPYFQADGFAGWSIGGKNVSQLLIAAYRSNSFLQDGLIGEIDDLFTGTFETYPPNSTNYSSSGPASFYKEKSAGIDFSRVTLDGRIPSVERSVLISIFQLITDSTVNLVPYISGTLNTPYRFVFGNVNGTFDVDKLFKWYWRECGNTVDLQGSFSFSNGIVSYRAGVGESDASSVMTYGLTPLSSLVSSNLYAQSQGFVDPVTDYNPIISLTDDVSGEFMGLVPFVIDRYHLLDDNSVWNKVRSRLGVVFDSEASWNNGLAGAAFAAQHIYDSDSKDRVKRLFQRVWASVTFYLFGFDPSDGYFGSLIPYEELFGKITITQLQASYRSYVESLWISHNRNLEWNSVYWLTYQRIYADWFLNEHYTKHEDYLDMVGSGYLAGYQSLINDDGTDMTDWFSPGQINNSRNPKILSDNTLSYFGNRIAAGECMPVLWSLDCVTNLIQSTSTSSTPVGQSITENFYNRFYARFKDLINRMGPDYRRNARALYGKGPDDASLLRSQVVGYRSFDVQIGDVAQNSESTPNSTLGQFAGYAVSRDKAGSFDWTAQESGVFMVLAWVRPKYTCFADLVPRSLYKMEYMDYLIPQFGGVGFQDFSYKQLCPTSDNPDSRLGFEERYSEYMMMDNECSGLMRTSMAYYNSNRIGTPCYTPGTADYYHLLYMDEESDLHRVFVDNVNDPVLISAYFNGNVTRQLPATIKTEF